MKTLSIFSIILFYTISVFGQAQEKGEFHRSILAKNDAENEQGNQKAFIGRGVIVFASEEIPRLGTYDDVNQILKTSFTSTESFYGRVYLPKSFGELKPKPAVLFYNLFIDGKIAKSNEIIKNESLPDRDWSTWLIDFPTYFKNEWSAIKDGEHFCKIECWVAYGNDVAKASKTAFPSTESLTNEKMGIYKFLASGGFGFTVGEVKTEDEELVVLEDAVLPNGDEELVDVGVPDAATLSDTTWTSAWYLGNPVYTKSAMKQLCTKTCVDLGFKEVDKPIFDNSTVFKFIIANNGDVASIPTNVVLQLDDIDSGDEKFHLEKGIPSLKPGERLEMEFRIEWKDLTAEMDKYSTKIVLDFDNNISETNRSNNTMRF